MSRVALVSLGRDQAMGEVRRVASWRQLFTAAGAEVVELPLAPDRRPHVDGVVAVARGDAPPERLAWSGSRVREAVADVDPDVVVVVSTRAFDPRVVGARATVVLDQVDSLARSYHDRAAIVDGLPRRVGYRTLAALHARVERRIRSAGVRRVAAGWSDALTLGAEWVPNLVDPTLAPLPGAAPDTDVLFFGTLRYPPNVDALERMGRLWPALQAARPGTTALVAGSAPTARVVELCRGHGWELVAGFSSLPEVAARARVAVAPLTRVAGIQNKVLDAAMVGLAQVVTPAALEGFAPGFPLAGHGSDEAFVTEVVRLLDAPGVAAAETEVVRAHVAAEYGAEHWQQWATEVLDHGA
jgi:hypothetical protein